MEKVDRRDSYEISKDCVSRFAGLERDAFGNWIKGAATTQPEQILVNIDPEIGKERRAAQAKLEEARREHLKRRVTAIVK